jgi:recombination protein RecR
MARLLTELEKLPGVGPRTAERLAYHLVRRGPDEGHQLSRAIDGVMESIRPCSCCFHLTDQDPCSICSDSDREAGRLLVVSQPKDLEVMEKAGWQGRYHVLLGDLSGPSGGADDGTADASLRALQARLQNEEIEEVVLGTNPDLEGDGTALAVAERIEQWTGTRVKVSRLARGVPTGAAIEYTNPAVLAEAIQERRALYSGSQ